MANPFTFGLAFVLRLLVCILTLKDVKPMVFEGTKAFHCEDNRFSVGSLFTAENVTLLGYVRKSVWTSTLIHCNQLCLSQPDWCISINFDTKTDQEKNKNLCELNHHGVETEQELFGNKFEKKIGFIFSQIRPVKYGRCPCKNGGSCHYDCASFEEKCLCTKGFYGKNCELSTCDITYPTYSTNNVILYPWTVAAYAMTFCTWVQLTDSSNQYPASLTQSNRGLGIIYRADGTILLRIDFTNIILDMSIQRDGNWQHLCIAWRNTDGKVSSYRNGQHVQSKMAFNTGGSIVGSGDLNICRRSDLGAAFIGKISNFNIWSSFMSANQIASMASSCQPLDSEGDIVKWSVVKNTRMDGLVSKDCPGTC